jgi:hypothetical protein
LSDSLGLEEAYYSGPSFVDYSTIQKSIPILSTTFLQGCGLADWQIESAKLLMSGQTQEDICSIGYEIIRKRGQQPIQMFSTFISYSSQDDKFARLLHQDLQGNGVRCWFAPEDMKVGDRMRQRIDEVIQLRDKLLLVLSKRSIASVWVEKEVETAFEKERESGGSVLFPIKLDNEIENIKTGWPADIRRTRHIGDFTDYENSETYQKALKCILRDLRATKEINIV